MHTQVSITFDDGDADQLATLPLLADNHIRATYYVIPGATGTPGYFSRADLDRIAAAGNEIGGHTTSHLNLTQVSADEAHRQVCDSRQTLTSWGFRVTSFAYPGGATNPGLQRTVAQCGYNSARLAAGLRFDNGRSAAGCQSCSFADSAPPADPYAIAVPGSVDQTWTLADLKDAVRRAEDTDNGWLPLVFHHVCATGCGPLSVTPAVLGDFLQWLDNRTAFGTVTRPVSDVIGGPVRPIVTGPRAAAHGVMNSSLEAAAPGADLDTLTESAASPGMPNCWMPGGYGDNKTLWRQVPDAHSGRTGEQLTVSNYHNGDAKLLQRFDLGQCSLPVAPGTPYTLGAWYKSSTQTQFSVYVRNADGGWRYWRSSRFFPATGDWTQASWLTPAIPAGTSAISFGLTLAANGSITTDDYTFSGPEHNSFGKVVSHPATLAGACLLVLMTGMFVLQRRGLIGPRD